VTPEGTQLFAITDPSIIVIKHHLLLEKGVTAETADGGWCSVLEADQFG
jgi:hypothetical protein